ncbi:TonB-dependent receptor [Massilia sp. TS11]|uniref:TonB-dependent receptor n=1 Tax=Massilia sp. TS11 TaxID=2908003 RepID=UPI001EDC2C15|nr:TonB-dependent receptor [Massilia sp. TS11]MCG2583685.1 TonB-dependent receptor [Massilia sp. TS11]
MRWPWLLLLLARAASADDEIVQRVLVEGARASQLGVLDAASAGSLTQKELAARPVYRPGELLEGIPGMVVSQHSGEGKANQFYLRGFNLDHGTDLRTTLDDMPLNQRSHAHGQGWTDLNVLIPELVARIDYRKGPYSARAGDFSAAGGADIRYADRLPQAVFSASAGQQGYRRVLLAASPDAAGGSLLTALEAVAKDGPFTTPEGYRKLNAVLRYSEGFANNGWSLSAMLQQAHWMATDQIPLRAVQAGTLGRFDAVDPSDGGASTRASLSWRWRRSDADSASAVSAYVVRATLDLYSNFSYYLNDPVHGDQFAQPDQRVTSGIDAAHTWHTHDQGRRLDLTLGLQGQHDNVFNGLRSTEARQTLAVLRADHLRESSAAAYAEASLRWYGPWRLAGGLRLDHYRFAVRGQGSRAEQIASPTLSAVYAPGPASELYLNLGGGFHSNDARTVLGADAPGLVRAHAAELGWRAALSPRWSLSAALYQLDLASELVWLGDQGSTEARGASRRRGVELSSYLLLARGIQLDADLALARASYRDGGELPGAVAGVGALALRLAPGGPWSGALRLRWFGPRALSEDGVWRSQASSTVNARLAYAWRSGPTLELEVFNLTNRRDSAIDYVYTSRLRNEAQAVDGIHFHPLEPRSLRLALVQRF